MKRFPVESTNLASVGYDEEKQVLEVEFENGGVYQYDNVPRDVFEDLQNASSKGRYFIEHVRNAGYAYRRLR